MISKVNKEHHGLLSILQIKEIPIFLFTFAVYTAFSILSPNFNNFNNFSVIIQQITINGIVAIGMTMVIMISGMDLSVGSILSLCGVLSGMLDNAGLPIYVVVLITLIIGSLAGAINGFLITRLNIPDIIVTLATMNIFRGIAVLITNSKWITDFSTPFLSIGSGLHGLMSFPVIAFAVFALFFAFMLKKMPFGRLMHAIGGNREAAELMGLNVNRVKVQVYTINGFLLAIAGMIFASMFGNIQAATAAISLQFQTMGSALIGGANIFGGSGSILGTVIGTFLLGIIKNGLVQIHASEYWLDFITGAIIIIALIVNLIKFKRRKRG